MCVIVEGTAHQEQLVCIKSRQQPQTTPPPCASITLAQAPSPSETVVFGTMSYSAYSKFPPLHKHRYLVNPSFSVLFVVPAPGGGGVGALHTSRRHPSTATHPVPGNKKMRMCTPSSLPIFSRRLCAGFSVSVARLQLQLQQAQW